MDPTVNIHEAKTNLSRIIEEVAKHDASTAWCLCQANGCAMSASYLDDDVADAIWGSDPSGVLAWGPGKSQARPEGDGYRVNAKCMFASGGRHATWIGTHATIVTSAFAGKSRVQQHQLVYKALKGKMGNELHALALTTSAPPAS